MNLQSEYLLHANGEHYGKVKGQVSDLAAKKKSEEAVTKISSIEKLTPSELPSDYISPLEAPYLRTGTSDKVAHHKRAVQLVNHLHPHPFPEEFNFSENNQIPKPAFKETDPREKVESECLKRIDELYFTEKTFVEDLSSIMEVTKTF